MKYLKSQKYEAPELMSKIMGPNPIKLEEELLDGCALPEGSVVCDLGSGQGLTSVFLVKEYGFTVYAADLKFEPEFFDGIVSTDSYNYFGRDPHYLDDKLLPFVKKGGLIYICIPGMKKDLHDDLPPEMLLSWTPEQLAYMRDTDYWRSIVGQSRGAEVLEVSEMESNDEVWADWLKQENEYAIGDRRSMEAGAGKYLNFIKIVLKKK